MIGQMTIWDLMAPQRRTDGKELQVGDYTNEAGPVIPHIMRPAFIGEKVLYDCHTESHPDLYRCGILEEYIPHEGSYRCIIYDGRRQRVLITMRPGMEIFETEPWNFEKRMNRRIQT